MHRRLQFGMRENPASERRHGSRLAVGSERLSRYSEGEGGEQTSPGYRNDSVLISSKNAADYEATGEDRYPPVSHEHGRQQRKMSGTSTFERLIDSEQAAELLGNIHVKTLQRYARLGRLPGYQIGGHWYFRESELNAWLRHQVNSKRQFVR